MLVEVLLVEGELDREILGALFSGWPQVESGGSKNALAPETRRRRQLGGRETVAYIRDRDFDFYPPDDTSEPTVDKSENGLPLGWRWCRHEIENYLIDPQIMSRVAELEVAVIESELVNAAKRIRAYEVARWVIGAARKQLPPHYELATRPAEVTSEIGLPSDVSDSSCHDWCVTSIRQFRSRIDNALGDFAIDDNLKDLRLIFSDESGCVFSNDIAATAANVLLWCSGKDVLAAMSDWLKSVGFKNPGEYRATARDWVIENSDAALELIPEWGKFRNILRIDSRRKRL